MCSSMQGKVGTGHRTVFSEGQRVVVFIYQPLKSYQLSSQVQQVLPKQQGGNTGVGTLQVLRNLSKALIGSVFW